MTDREPLNVHGERVHLAMLRLYVLTVYRPLTRHVVRPLTRLLSHPRA
jgi:hypothetical protein